MMKPRKKYPGGFRFFKRKKEQFKCVYAGPGMFNKGEEPVPECVYAGPVKEDQELPEPEEKVYEPGEKIPEPVEAPTYAGPCPGPYGMQPPVVAAPVYAAPVRRDTK